MIPVQQGQHKGPPAGVTGVPKPKPGPKAPSAGVWKPKAPPAGAAEAPVPKPKPPPVGVTVQPPRTPVPEQMAAPPLPPPPPPPRGTAGRAVANPKGKAPSPPALPMEDVWNNRHVSSNNRDLLTTCVPEWIGVFYGLGADGKHILDWRASVERYKDSDLPVLRDTSVEDYLKTLRRENRRAGETVVEIALTLKGELMTEKFLSDVSDKAKDIVNQQSRVAEHVRMSSGPLPADVKKDDAWDTVNAAMDSLHTSQSGGIVLVTGGTGTGKSSVLPGYLYLHTIDKASKMNRSTF
eukprot:6052523-Amphidinium_carterae.1